MALTLADAITEVRDNLNEATAAFWTDAQITKWIKEGCRNFSSKSQMVEATDTIDPMVQNQLSYSSSDETWIADILEPHTCLYDDGSNVYKGLIKVDPKQIGNLATQTAGPPKYYCLFNRTLYIFPLSSAAVAAAGSVSVLYSKETDDITALRDEFQHLPIIYATAKAKQRDMKFGQAQTLMMQFKEETMAERQDKLEADRDTTEEFKVPGRQNRGRR